MQSCRGVEACKANARSVERLVGTDVGIDLTREVLGRVVTGDKGTRGIDFGELHPWRRSGVVPHCGGPIVSTATPRGGQRAAAAECTTLLPISPGRNIQLLGKGPVAK